MSPDHAPTRVAIRPATPDDAAAIAEIYRPYVERGTVSFETDAPDADAIARRMASSSGLYPWLVATEGEGGAVLGYAYASAFRDRPAYRYTIETTVYLQTGTHGRGNGRQLYDALIDTVRAQGFTHAIGVIALPNDHSIRLHESVGFKRAGFFREAGVQGWPMDRRRLLALRPQPRDDPAAGTKAVQRDGDGVELVIAG